MTTPAGQMTDLLGDAGHRSVLGLQSYSADGDVFDEAPLPFPLCPGRVDPGGRDLAGDGARPGPAANASAGPNSITVGFRQPRAPPPPARARRVARARRRPPPLPPRVHQPPPPAAPVQTADPFGESITLEGKKVVVAKGNANWDSAFDTLIDSFKALNALLDK